MRPSASWRWPAVLPIKASAGRGAADWCAEETLSAPPEVMSSFCCEGPEASPERGPRLAVFLAFFVGVHHELIVKAQVILSSLFAPLPKARCSTRKIWNGVSVVPPHFAFNLLARIR